MRLASANGREEWAECVCGTWTMASEWASQWWGWVTRETDDQKRVWTMARVEKMGQVQWYGFQCSMFNVYTGHSTHIHLATRCYNVDIKSIEHYSFLLPSSFFLANVHSARNAPCTFTRSGKIIGKWTMNASRSVSNALGLRSHEESSLVFQWQMARWINNHGNRYTWLALSPRPFIHTVTTHLDTLLSRTLSLCVHKKNGQVWHWTSAFVALCSLSPSLFAWLVHSSIR